MTDLVVVGSLNQDIRLTVNRIPRSGETVSAVGAMRSPGGKGANQAVAAARLGLAVAMVGAVGQDPAGHQLRERLAAEGVDVRGVAVLAELGGNLVGTGTATILWEQPESTIVIEAGANAAVDEAFVRAHAATFRDARAVLCQCETPLGALAAVTREARGLKVLNPAPAVAVPSEIRDRFDLLVPNRFELAVLAHAAEAPERIEDVIAMVHVLRFPGDVVVTLGGDGCLVMPQHGEPVTVPAQEVTAVDTTAAGDSFCAGLVDGLLAGQDLTSAARWASRVAAATTTRDGAIDSLPRLEEVREAADA
ncbi:MAG: ribokinase [Georgenia sp.]